MGRHMRKHVLTLLVSAFLVVAALVAVGGSLSGPSRWSPDGLFYQAKIHEIRGSDDAAALQRAFTGPLGRPLAAADPQRSGDPAWFTYNARFYERRLALPLAGAALTPVAGDRALLDLSLAGYVAAVLAVFALLLLRFRLPIATFGALATLALPALVHHSSFPLTDSWGLALETVALASGLLVLDRGRRWLVLWVVALALLSITRDSVWLPILAAAWMAVSTRSRDSLWLLGTGLLAALPAMALVSVPMRELLAQMLSTDLQPHPGDSWGTILGSYPRALADLLQDDGGFVRDGAWYSAFFLLGGLGALLALGRGRDAAFMKAGALAGVAYVLAVPVFSAFRLELVWVPFAAFGLALAGERVAARFPRLAWVSSPSVARQGGHA